MYSWGSEQASDVAGLVAAAASLEWGPAASEKKGAHLPPVRGLGSGGN